MRDFGYWMLHLNLCQKFWLLKITILKKIFKIKISKKNKKTKNF